MNEKWNQKGEMNGEAIDIVSKNLSASALFFSHVYCFPSINSVRM